MKPILAVCLNPVIQNTLVFYAVTPDQVNRAARYRVDASGKGVNVTRVLTQLGQDCVHLTHAGGQNRDWFLAMCRMDGLDVRWVDSGSDIRICTTVIDLSAGTATELVQEAQAVQPNTEADFMRLFDMVLPSCAMLVVSGTKASGYSDRIIPRMAERAFQLGIPAILDIKGQDLLACLRWRPLVVKPNIHEALATWQLGTEKSEGLAKPLRAHIAAIAAELKIRYGTELVVTRGKESIWFNEDGQPAEEPIVPAQVINPIGSGDSFTAGLAHVMLNGGSLREAVREGAQLGAQNAENLKVGSLNP